MTTNASLLALIYMLWSNVVGLTFVLSRKPQLRRLIWIVEENDFFLYSQMLHSMYHTETDREGENPLSCPIHASLVTAITSQQDCLAGAPNPPGELAHKPSDLKHILSLSPPQISLGFTRDTQTSLTANKNGRTVTVKYYISVNNIMTA